jgi:hypothetical protein
MVFCCASEESLFFVDRNRVAPLYYPSITGYLTSTMKTLNRPKRTAAELVALINQRQADWWPTNLHLRIDRSAEHDWIAVVDYSPDGPNENFGSELAKAVGQVVADLRLRNAWTGQ